MPWLQFECVYVFVCVWVWKLALTLTRQPGEENYGAFRPVLQDLKKTLHWFIWHQMAGLAYKITQPTPSEREKRGRHRQKNNSQESKYNVLILNFLQSKKSTLWFRAQLARKMLASDNHCISKTLFSYSPGIFLFVSAWFSSFLKERSHSPVLHAHFGPSGSE